MREEAWVRRWLALGGRRKFIVCAAVYLSVTLEETEKVLRVDTVSRERKRKNCESSYFPAAKGVYTSLIISAIYKAWRQALSRRYKLASFGVIASRR
jgi:hypothetical protein